MNQIYYSITFSMNDKVSLNRILDIRSADYQKEYDRDNTIVTVKTKNGNDIIKLLIILKKEKEDIIVVSVIFHNNTHKKYIIKNDLYSDSNSSSCIFAEEMHDYTSSEDQ